MKYAKISKKLRESIVPEDNVTIDKIEVTPYEITDGRVKIKLAFYGKYKNFKGHAFTFDTYMYLDESDVFSINMPEMSVPLNKLISLKED